ncbi:hypothetical protein F5Y06DRAFT_171077 [Hypoxylon sp. FL0890]|nr:hypothetical protein F5Y06DRAFT_171077 [Hypoxylon sp. FL0890]
MAHWEASQPPPRHSTHHYRRNNQPRDENNSHDVPDSRSPPKRPRKRRKGDSTIAKSNSASQPQARYDIIENWLEQTARQSPTSWSSTSQGHRKVAENSYPSGLLNATSPYNKHPGRVDPRWSSRHGFPGDRLRQSASPFQDLGLGDQRKSRRRRAAPSNSSFISGFEISTKPPDNGTGSIQRDRGKVPRPKPLGEARLGPIGASSTTSHVDEEVNFEKRPRRKTREDKYETKKKKRKHEQEGDPSHDDHRRKKRKRAEKRKTTISGKNIVNNFRSDAVLNNRITVQPHLKPGLFDNGRTSKKQPISDLAFSEMQFLKRQKRDTLPKPLSKSRLREKQREGREMEEVSSFFLPHAANGNTRKSRPRSPRTHDHREWRHRGELPYPHVQELSKPPLLDRCSIYERARVSRGREETIEAPSLDPHGSGNDGKESGRNTAYFTWSSSRRSPQHSRRENSSSPNVSDSVWTTTPNPIRRDLIATGIYRNTGIALYDDRLSEQSMGRKTLETKMPSIRRIESEDSAHNTHYEFTRPQKVSYRDQAIMTEDPPTNFEPQHDVRTTEEHQEPGSQKESNTQLPPVLQVIDRQQIVKDVRLTPVERGDSRQIIRGSNALGTEAIATHRSPRLVDTGVNQNSGRQTQEITGGASMTSGDVMPPPPVPNGRHSSLARVQAGVGEAAPLPQNVPTTNIATEVLGDPHPVSYNKDVQDTREHPNSCNQTGRSFESAMDNETALSYFNTDSWIPQRTPSARIREKQNVHSRPSTRTPIYIGQYEGKSSGNPHSKDLIESQAPENMADFIARIESESQLRSPPRDSDILGSESETGGAELEHSPFGTNILQEQYSTQSWEENTCEHLTPNPHASYSNPGNPRADQQQEGEFYIETQFPEYEIGVPRNLPDVMQPLEDFEEERFQMSNFWRPNQFSQF